MRLQAHLMASRAQAIAHAQKRRCCTKSQLRGQSWRIRIWHETLAFDDSCDLRACPSAQDRAQLQAVATRLARAGASLEVADLEGRTALHLAAGCGDAAMVAHLLHLGADVNATDSVGGEARVRTRICIATVAHLLQSRRRQRHHPGAECV